MFSIVFLILLCCYGYLGVVFCRDKQIKQFVYFTVILPITPALTPLHTRFQITIYYAFLIIPIVLFALTALKRKQLNKVVASVGMVVCGFIMLYLPWGIFQNSQDSTIVNLLKDLKPILFLFVGFLFLTLLRGQQLAWNGPFAAKLLRVNFFVTLFFFLLLNTTNVLGFVSNDVFYKTMSTRYLSMGTFYVIFYFIAQLAANKKLKPIELLYIIIPIILSGNRTFLLVLLAVFVISTVMAISNVQLFIKRMLLFFGGGILLVIGILNFNTSLRERALSLFHVTDIFNELSERRFSPFFSQLDGFEWYHYLFGKGLGETFFIPWFEYRENIENYNIYMDNIYMTLYVKYGLGMLAILLLFFYFINRTNTNKKYKILIISYFSIIGLTTSFLYQYSFLFILLLLAAFKIHGPELETKDL